MRRDADVWSAFYATELGAAVRLALRDRLTASWGDVRALSLLGVGYPGPHLADFDGARRVVGVGLGSVAPHAGCDARVRADHDALPFADASFDRVLLIHALEQCADPAAGIREAARVLASSGRMAVATSARSGLWARMGATPLARGRPWGGGELAAMLREAGLEVTGRFRLLHTPPVAGLAKHAAKLERAGVWLWPALGGLVLVEAVRRDFVRPSVRRTAPIVAAPALVRPITAAPSASGRRTC